MREQEGRAVDLEVDGVVASMLVNAVDPVADEMEAERMAREGVDPAQLAHVVDLFPEAQEVIDGDLHGERGTDVRSLARAVPVRHRERDQAFRRSRGDRILAGAVLAHVLRAAYAGLGERRDGGRGCGFLRRLEWVMPSIQSEIGWA